MSIDGPLYDRLEAPIPRALLNPIAPEARNTSPAGKRWLRLTSVVRVGDITYQSQYLEIYVKIRY